MIHQQMFFKVSALVLGQWYDCPLGQSYHCPNASQVILVLMDKIVW